MLGFWENIKMQNLIKESMKTEFGSKTLTLSQIASVKCKLRWVAPCCGDHSYWRRSHNYRIHV